MSDAPHWFERLAHDLRGPLMPLQTAAYLLRSGQIDAERQQELVALIERQTRRLAGMIDELDDWSHACRDALLLTREACVPALLLDDAAGAAVVAAGARPEIIDESGDVQVSGDRLRLTQLIRTLLEFANRHPPARLRMRVQGRELRVDAFSASATPEPAQLAAMLERPLPETIDEGLGLRLPIARAIAKAHGGSLEADGAETGGVCLICRLPLAPD